MNRAERRKLERAAKAKARERAEAAAHTRPHDCADLGITDEHLAQLAACSEVLLEMLPGEPPYTPEERARMLSISQGVLRRMANDPAFFDVALPIAREEMAKAQIAMEKEQDEENGGT